MGLQLLVIAVLALFVIPLWMVYKPPVFLINRLQARFPDVLFHIQTTRKIVALTIDDAPSEYTTQILEILKANDARATFFAIGGQIPGRESLLEDILKQDSELGNHAMHDEPSINLPSSTLKIQIQDVDALISAAYTSANATSDITIERTDKFFRPGSGIFSQRLLDIISELGYKTILGSVYPHDPFIAYWRINARHILSRLRPGAVIICHDRRSWTVPMLKKVVPEMKRRGYEVVTVTELLEATGKG